MKLTEDQKYLLAMRKIDQIGQKMGFRTKVLWNNIWITLSVVVIIIICGSKLFFTSFSKGIKKNEK